MPTVLIEFCQLCHFEKSAYELVTRIEEEFDLACMARSGSWGTYRIVWGDRVIFNRWTDRGWFGWIGFGTNISTDEVLERLRKAGAPPKTRTNPDKLAL